MKERDASPPFATRTQRASRSSDPLQRAGARDVVGGVGHVCVAAPKSGADRRDGASAVPYDATRRVIMEQIRSPLDAVLEWFDALPPLMQSHISTEAALLLMHSMKGFTQDDRQFETAFREALAFRPHDNEWEHAGRAVCLIAVLDLVFDSNTPERFERRIAWLKKASAFKPEEGFPLAATAEEAIARMPLLAERFSREIANWKELRRARITPQVIAAWYEYLGSLPIRGL